GALGGNAKGVVDEFNSFFSDAKDAVENLKAFIENVEEHGPDIVKGKLASIKDRIHKNPFESIQEVGRVLANVETKDFDLMSTCGTFSKGSKLEVSPSKALSSLQGFMEGYTQGLESSSDTKQQEQGKIFRQALMLLASPNGIALTTPENIILQASQDIAESASGSINLSAQKNIIGHAQDKISLFAAQKGLSAFAAKGPIKVQAQTEGIEILSRKNIKILSVEDKIEIVGQKEIVLNAGGSQLTISDKGVFINTPRLFHAKAGQHKFDAGAIINYSFPNLPSMYYGNFNITDKNNNPIGGQKYKMTLPSGKEILGFTDENGNTVTGYSGEDNQNLKLEIIEDLYQDIWYQPNSTYEYETIDDLELPVNFDKEVDEDE
ncbi:type VI secretion system protein, partial [Acinetobacter baumannii]